MSESKIVSNIKFDKVQGEIYTTINGKKCQVKTKFSLNNTFMEIARFKNKEVICG